MKRLVYTILFSLLISSVAIGQTKDVFSEVPKVKVPNSVIETFNRKYPKEVADRWAIYRDTYEAKIYKDEHWVFSRYDKDGNFIEDRIMMDWDEEAPKNLKEGKNKTGQKHWEVTEFYKRISNTEDISYILQLRNDDNELETLYFDKRGVLEVKSQSGY